jgi:hypothetical protein
MTEDAKAKENTAGDPCGAYIEMFNIFESTFSFSLCDLSQQITRAK